MQSACPLLLVCLPWRWIMCPQAHISTQKSTRPLPGQDWPGWEEKGSLSIAFPSLLLSLGMEYPRHMWISWKARALAPSWKESYSPLSFDFSGTPKRVAMNLRLLCPHIGCLHFKNYYKWRTSASRGCAFALPLWSICLCSLTKNIQGFKLWQ